MMMTETSSTAAPNTTAVTVTITDNNATTVQCGDVHMMVPLCSPPTQPLATSTAVTAETTTAVQPPPAAALSSAAASIVSTLSPSSPQTSSSSLSGIGSNAGTIISIDGCVKSSHLDDKNGTSVVVNNQISISENYLATGTSIETSKQGSLITANATPKNNAVSISGAALVMGKQNNSSSQSASTTNNNSNNHTMSTVAASNSGITLANITNHHSSNNVAPLLVSGRCGPSMIHYKNLKFLITDKPTDATLSQYINELQRRNATDVVRVCESTYSSKQLEINGIKCHDWAFDDGTPPPQKIINDWLNLIIERSKDQTNQSNEVSNQSPEHAANSQPCIAVHCVAGLGRAPVLVAIALIEAGLKYEDAVERIRNVRRGAINAKQLQYLSQYKPKKVLMFSTGSNSKRKFCCIV